MEIIEKFSYNNDCYKNNKNRVDSRYINFQKIGPRGLMLHSVGCPQPSAEVFANIWNKSNYSVSVHAAVQADGKVYQCLPWNYRGWHAGGDANNTHIGVEMTEPSQIKYTSGSSFTCNNKAAAIEQVRGTYNTAVELFATLCIKYNLDPMKDGVIISHKGGWARGVASNHGDPEHLWKGLGLNYTMDTFRKDVKNKMEEDEMTLDKFSELMEEYNSKLNDNDSGEWSKEARAWAINEGLINGIGKLPTGEPNYAWESPLTREQFVTMLYRFQKTLS